MPHRRDIFKHAEKLGFGELHFKIDHETQLFAIIAIHNLKRGPALGGCRWRHYDNTGDAIYDALRLARGMTFKSAISHLPHGGGKAVIIRPAKVRNKERYFEAYAKFINELGGIYITAADSGTTVEEMDLISKYTKFVTSTSKIGNPAIYTAHGVLRGIEAAVKFKLGKDSLKGLHITIQGVGQVGYLLAKSCHELGATLTVSDVNDESTLRCAQEFGAEIVSPKTIHTVKADVFAPCALGAILNHQTISKIQSPIIVGSANNQLAANSDGHLLHRLGILYAPDYVANAGGVIQASAKYYGDSEEKLLKKVDGIYDTLTTIFERSSKTHKSTSDIADELAMEILENE
ncbi:MAG TPA: amino acid dehydrogenase [Gammaproteobacteria bacterium]|nr:amino acid dehydrogenase [Gammaproteobacteria bacterium]